MTFPARLVAALCSGALALALAACSADSSSNPLSPSVAGPIAGVTLTAPRPLEPANGAELRTGEPIRLLLENASSNSERPFWYEIDVALDSEFAARVASVDRVQPGPDGRSTYTVGQSLAAGRVYYWRARALDGANTSPYSSVANFRLVDPISIEAPAPVSPVNGVTIGSTTPTLVARNTAVNGPAGPITYRFEIATDPGFAQVVAAPTAARSGGDMTSVQAPSLAGGTEYFWRVQASDGNVGSPYSSPQSFRTPGGGGGGPNPPPNPPPGGGGGGGPWPRSGEEVVAWATANYSQYLRPVGSLSERRSNMDFVRDRMIEAGRCGGMDLGLNLKRGGPEISNDYLAQRIAGQTHGIDIAHDFDNIGITMRLTWADKGTNDSAVYMAYPNPLPCR